jgi:hypothetical protein
MRLPSASWISRCRPFRERSIMARVRPVIATYQRKSRIALAGFALQVVGVILSNIYDLQVGGLMIIIGAGRASHLGISPGTEDRECP